MPNKGTEYEIIAEKITKQILANDFEKNGYPKPNVKRDIRLHNGIRERQCDIVWDIPMGFNGISTVIIECKNYGRKVEASDVELLPIIYPRKNIFRAYS